MHFCRPNILLSASFQSFAYSYYIWQLFILFVFILSMSVYVANIKILFSFIYFETIQYIGQLSWSSDFLNKLTKTFKVCVICHYCLIRKLTCSIRTRCSCPLLLAERWLLALSRSSCSSKFRTTSRNPLAPPGMEPIPTTCRRSRALARASFSSLTRASLREKKWKTCIC